LKLWQNSNIWKTLRKQIYIRVEIISSQGMPVTIQPSIFCLPVSYTENYDLAFCLICVRFFVSRVVVGPSTEDLRNKDQQDALLSLNLFQFVSIIMVFIMRLR